MIFSIEITASAEQDLCDIFDFIAYEQCLPETAAGLIEKLHKDIAPPSVICPNAVVVLNKSRGFLWDSEFGIVRCMAFITRSIKVVALCEFIMYSATKLTLLAGLNLIKFI